MHPYIERSIQYKYSKKINFQKSNKFINKKRYAVNNVELTHYIIFL